MAEVFCDDIVEQILIRSDVEDIIRCKRVCKSWYSLISSSRFVNSHLKLNNNAVGRKRIVINTNDNILFGSSNGLVSMLTSDYNICVLNPCTRELKNLKNLDFLADIGSHIYGFGYDSSSDDYKVIVGKWDSLKRLTCFYLLSLKLNVWKVVGYFDFDFCNGSAGILSNGALHWLIRDQNDYYNIIILAFDLSKEEFKTITTPVDKRFKHTSDYALGIIEECLCIYDDRRRDRPKWVMKNYNDKQYWEHVLQWDKDITQSVKVLLLKSYYRAKTFFDHSYFLSETLKYISAPVYVESLVSPHINKRRNRNGIEDLKLIKAEQSIPHRRQ